MSDRPIVIVYFDERREPSVHFAGDVDVFWIDVNCASEPIYKMTVQGNPKLLWKMVGEGPWAHAGDGWREAVEGIIEERVREIPRLTIVKDDAP